MLSLVLSPLACSFEPQLDLTRYEACDTRGDCAVEACSCLEKWWICALPKAAPEACRPEEPTCEIDAECDDGIACTDDSCNTATDECINSPNDLKCPDDNLFCNGSRTCDADKGCIGTGNPCTAAGQTCDEESRTCLPSAECGNGIVDELDGEDCDPGPSQNDNCCDIDTCRWTTPGLPDPQGKCSGALECQLNVCGGEGECTIANEEDHTPCMDDGLFCNGIEWCQAGVCDHAGSPCEAEGVCDEAFNICEPCGNDEYSYRKRITIQAGAAPVPRDYSVYFTEDTETLINEDKLRSDGHDWRIYYLNGPYCIELDRWIDTDLGGGLDSTTTRTWFKTQAAINAADSDGSYFVHYGNVNAGTPPADWSDSMGAGLDNEPSKVFLAADDFEEQIEGQQPDGWILHEGCSGIVVVNDGDNKVLDDGPGDGGNVTAGNPEWTDVAVRQKVKSIDGEIDHAGVVVRYFDETHEVYGGIVTNTTSEIWNRTSEDWGEPIGGPWSMSTMEIGWQVEELRIAGDTVDFYLNDIFIGGGTIHAGVPTQGASGFWCQYHNHNAYRDNHIVRLYVDPEPTAGAGTEELLP